MVLMISISTVCPCSRRERGDVVGLPECELRAATADAQIHLPPTALVSLRSALLLSSARKAAGADSDSASTGLGTVSATEGRRPCFAERIDAGGVVLARGLLERLHRRMEKLVDEAAGEGFDGGELFCAEDAELGVHALEFVLANLFGLALQRDDGRGDVDGAAALMEALDLGGDEGLGVAGLRLRSSMCEAATCCRSSMS